MTTFIIHTVESAPAEVKEVLETVQKDNNGYIPTQWPWPMLPTALEAYRTVGAINRRNSLTPVERVSSTNHSCNQWLCFHVAGHTFFHQTNPDE